MDYVHRYFHNNLLGRPGAVIDVDSEVAGMTRGALLRPGVSDVLRFGGPYVITNENNKIDFNRGGVKVATIANGAYSATTLATAIAATSMVAIQNCSGATLVTSKESRNWPGIRWPL